MGLWLATPVRVVFRAKLTFHAFRAVLTAHVLAPPSRLTCSLLALCTAPAVASSAGLGSTVPSGSSCHLPVRSSSHEWPVSWRLRGLSSAGDMLTTTPALGTCGGTSPGPVPTAVTLLLVRMALLSIQSIVAPPSMGHQDHSWKNPVTSFTKQSVQTRTCCRWKLPGGLLQSVPEAGWSLRAGSKGSCTRMHTHTPTQSHTPMDVQPHIHTHAYTHLCTLTPTHCGFDLHLRALV